MRKRMTEDQQEFTYPRSALRDFVRKSPGQVRKDDLVDREILAGLDRIKRKIDEILERYHDTK